MPMSRYKIRLFIISILFLGLYSCKSGKKSSSSKSNTSISKTKSKSSSGNAAVSKTIKTARTYHGTKYKYGGNDKKGIDCSGLMCQAYKSVNIQLPRTSSAQSNYGKRVYQGQIKPGDLVFFATGSSNSKITHVGLVTEVSKTKDIKFIHATTKRGVCEDWLSQAYYKKAYIKANRVFN